MTAELSPPDSADPAAVSERARYLSDSVDAINAPDASGANVHVSSVAVSALLIRDGHEPVLQLACRDRNRIALQGELMGAAALGVQNVLCLSGDDVTNGDQPEAKRVFDLDSLQLLRTAAVLRDKAQFLSGRKLEVAPKLFLGAASNPFVPPFDWRPQRLAKKIEAGADFIQTQFCFDVDCFREFMQKVRDLGLHERTYILVGVGPLLSVKYAEYMRTKVPGVVIPDKVVERLRQVPKEKGRQEGKKICVEIIQQAREIEGVAGVHFMAYRREDLVAEIIEETGISPRQREQAGAYTGPN